MLEWRDLVRGAARNLCFWWVFSKEMKFYVCRGEEASVFIPCDIGS